MAISDSGSSPYVFGAIFGFCQAVGILLFIQIAANTNSGSKSKIFSSKKEYWCAIYSCFKNIYRGNHSHYNKRHTGMKKIYSKYPVAFLLIGRFGILLYALSTSSIDIIIAAILFEISTWWFVLLRWIDGRKTMEKNKSLYYGKQTYFFLFFAIVGVFLVNFSETGTIKGAYSFAAIFGGIFALLAGFLNGLNEERSHKVGEYAEKIWKVIFKSKRLDYETIKKIKLHIILLSVALTTLVTGVISLLIYIGVELHSSENAFNFSAGWIIAIFFTLICNPAVTIFKRIANEKSDSLEINSITYATPAIAIIWLLAFNYAEVSRLDLLFLGASSIIAVNIIINIRTEEQRMKLGFKWLVVSIIASGSFIFLRDPIFEKYANDNWLWNGSTDYFAFLGLSATIFVFILAFRRQRLMELISEEERGVSSLFYRIGALQQHSIERLRGFIYSYKLNINSNLDYKEKLKKIIKPISDKHALELNSVILFDQAKPSSDLTYEKFIIENSIERHCNNKKMDAEKSKLFAQVNYLFYSKSKGSDMIEIIIFVMMSFMTISLALFTRPNFDTWNGLIYDSFILLFSSTISFLTINQFDLRLERRFSVFIRPDGAESKWINSIIPVCLCLVLLILFIALYYGKWISDWGWASEVSPTNRSNEQH